MLLKIDVHSIFNFVDQLNSKIFEKWFSTNMNAATPSYHIWVRRSTPSGRKGPGSCTTAPCWSRCYGSSSGPWSACCSRGCVGCSNPTFDRAGRSPCDSRSRHNHYRQRRRNTLWRLLRKTWRMGLFIYLETCHLHMICTWYKRMDVILLGKYTCKYYPIT